MPRLRIEGEDGHYTIKTRAMPSGEFQTWQVDEDGIQYLKDDGIVIPRKHGEVVEISKPLFNKLISLDFVYIKNKGGRGEPEPLLATTQKNLFLSFRAKLAQHWELAVRAYNLPPAWSMHSPHRDRDLARCTLAINDPNVFLNGETHPLNTWNVPAILNKQPCVVEPRSGIYSIKSTGIWPAHYRPQDWLHDVDGVRGHGTLFHDTKRDGLRLETNEVVYPGRRYYLVALAQANIKIPPELSPQRLEDDKSWQAWEITFPETMLPDLYQIISSWCQEVSHPLRELPWRLALISPPARQYIDNIPLLEHNQEVIIEVLPPTDPVQGAETIELQVKCNDTFYLQTPSPIEAHCYFTFSLAQPGDYYINGIDGFARPLVFKVTAATTHKIDVPQALQVILRTEKQKFTCKAYDPTVSSNSSRIIDLAHFGEGSIPGFMVSCPVSIDLSWECGTEKNRKYVKAEDIKNNLDAALLFAWRQHKPLKLKIDAGSFGMLNLLIRPSL